MSAAAHPDRIWWSPAEIAAAKLPGLPGTKRRVNSHAEREGWTGRTGLSRRRAGRGGGWEYHWSLFPAEARVRLLKEAAPAPAPAPRGAPDGSARAEAHARFEQLTEKARETARTRHRILCQVLALEDAGLGRDLAVREVARNEGKAPRSIWNWFDRVAFVERSDWLPFLADGRSTARREARRREIDPAFLDLLKADYLRVEKPSFSSSYRRAEEDARGKGIEVPPEHAARRRLQSEIPRVTMVYKREGYGGLAKTYPPQIRDRTQLHALEGVNADCHKFDVFVDWPGHEAPVRVQIVCFQDLYSGKILSWRFDHSPNKVMVMAAFGDLVDRWGIPKHCLFDNGREFANKWMTGGAPTRFRFKVRDDDPAGVLTLLGVQIHWAKPAHGQAKPVERAFRDFADDIAKDPRFAGAYVGNRPDAKPENYRSRAIALDRFIDVVEEGIARHNAREGRLSETANGRSFDETFATSYANAPVNKATEEQRRLWLMGQEVRKLHATHGRLWMAKNGYWSDWMSEHAGETVVARFDPEDLHAGVYVYDRDGRFLGHAACQEKVGFFDATEAHQAARRDGQIKRAQRKLARALSPQTVDDVAAALDAAEGPEARDPEAKVVRGTFTEAPRTDGARVARPAPEAPAPSAEEAARHEAFVLNFQSRKAGRQKQEAEEDARTRFDRAREIQARSEAGERLGEAEAKWLRSYAETSEYRQMKRMFETLGRGNLSG